MPKQLVIGAFEEFTPNFIANTWHHPRAETKDFARLDFWLDLVRTVESGGFDFFFLAEAVGYPMNDDGEVPEAVIREAVQFPVHDPTLLMAAIGAAVPRIALVATASTTAQRPLLNARDFTTLDHLTEGRIAWNIVTSDNQQALVRLLDLGEVTPHDERYARADEYMQLMLQLWEGAWEDGALIADKAAKVFADPQKVHRIVFDGDYFHFDGYYQATPSPQRTPTLFQAGTSNAGTDFAARYAECVFTQDRDPARLVKTVKRLRDKVVAAGRPADSLKIVNGASFVVAETEEEADRLRAELTSTPTREATAALFLGWSGVDLTQYDPEQTLDDVSTEVGQTMVTMWRNEDGTSPTIGEVMDLLPTTFGGVRFTGTAESIADQVEELVEATDIDGILVENMYGGAAGYVDFIEQVMPALRRRGLLPAEPRSGTAREMLTSATDPGLPQWHPGLQFRR
ncbi:NtaA/DmoA family FMN-dependent monooxygenase [Naumannella halotolerans]|uniref:FMN-dependent oxidoreductase (Nitrilotriacetate monooxygenase family) n=1 Tax=Naumannella halotolerans TaxID=993414 RepID=A0A4R7J7X8_9ACTN|nr:NtaA/DmoA family FMN-dependent monooxygenase [Naumannella halotolerans]TDT33571.1 FMN-dependent oxidoreductase (nitrilotriacetate monooxygenase family) [Naumannella halotolerans]